MADLAGSVFRGDVSWNGLMKPINDKFESGAKMPYPPEKNRKFVLKKSFYGAANHNTKNTIS